MSDPEPHSWRTAYRLAVLEPDPAKMRSRIDAALRAIEERLRQPIEIGSPGHKEIENAKEALAILKTERAGRSV